MTLFVLAVTLPLSAATAVSSTQSVTRLAYIEPNVGQAPLDVRFVGRAADHLVLLSGGMLSIMPARAPYDVITLRFEGATPGALPYPEGRLSGCSNYLTPSASGSVARTNVPHFRRVTVPDLYPGIDLVLRSTDSGTFEYDLAVAPRADPTSVTISVDGASYAGLDSEGGLVLEGRTFRTEQRLAILAPTGIHARVPRARFRRVADRRFRLGLGQYDRDAPLVIDPVICFSTFLGGTQQEEGGATATDASGNIYVAAQSASLNFPTKSPYQAAFGGGSTDAVVSKFDALGSLVFSTYIGGSGADGSRASHLLAIDPLERIILVGNTSSADFPLIGPFQPPYGGGAQDAFVLRLQSSGTALDFSFYLGGSDWDAAEAVALDATGDIYVAGATLSDDFPTTPGAFQTVRVKTSVEDAFLAKVRGEGSGLIYSTFLGGSGSDVAHAVAVDALGEALLAGVTDSADFPIARPLQVARKGIAGDVFLAALSPDGSTLAFSTYFGGTGFDEAVALSVAPNGDALLPGVTRSGDFPLTTPLQGAYGGAGDAFLARFDLVTPAIVYSTYLGGSAYDAAWSVGEQGGAVYVSGTTESIDFPILKAIQPTLAGARDAFVAAVAADGSPLLLSTYYGGADIDYANDAELSPAGGIVVAGKTMSTNFPVANAVQGTLAGGQDVFVARLDCWIAASAGLDISVCPGTMVALDGSGSVGCLTGFQYQWSEGATVRCPWSGNPRCSVTPIADTTYRLEVSCAACSTCQDAAQLTVTMKPDPLPPDQGNVLNAVRNGVDVAMTFPGPPLPGGWRLYRDADKRSIGVTALAPDASVASYADGGAVPAPPALGFYQVKGLSPCSRSPGPP